MIHPYPLQMYFTPNKACPSCGFDEEVKPTEFPDRYNSSTKNQQKMLMSG
jgi:hypothetical protein